MSCAIQRLKARADFLACAASGHKWVRPSFVIQLRYRDVLPGEPRLGFTTTKRLGNAVVRNRIRRRLREAARFALPCVARENYDYVVIGRPDAATIDFLQLQKEMTDGLRKLHHLVDKKPST